MKQFLILATLSILILQIAAQTSSSSFHTYTMRVNNVPISIFIGQSASDSMKNGGLVLCNPDRTCPFPTFNGSPVTCYQYPRRPPGVVGVCKYQTMDGAHYHFGQDMLPFIPQI